MSHFTVEEGLKVQEIQINEWKEILNEKAIKALEMEAKICNNQLNDNSTGYDVWRGTDMNMFVHNLASKLLRNKLRAENNSAC